MACCAPKSLIISHLVAMAENRAIGKGGGLPWHLPEDFRFFKAKTMGHAMIMGRKTFESIGRPLPGRLSVVVTRAPGYEAPEGVVVVPAIADAYAYCEAHRAQWGAEVFVIGGGEIYAQTLGDADRIYLTRVHRAVEGDTYYPEVPPGAFRLAREEKGAGPVPFTWQTLERAAPES